MALPAFETLDITRLYQTGRGIFHIDLTVTQGEIVGLVGPNGSGKSTLIRILSTAMRPTRGVFFVFGMDGLSQTARIRSRMGVVFDRTPHFENLTGFENAWFFARNYRLNENEARQNINSLFDWLGLYPYRNEPVQSYSFGMKKKLGLIEALSHNPDILLLDEPSLGLDYPSQLSFTEKLRELARKGKTVIIATNDVHEAESLCHRIVFLHKGRVVLQGSPQVLIGSLMGVRRFTFTLANPIPLEEISHLEGVQKIVAEDERVEVLSHLKHDLLPNIVRKVAEVGGQILKVEIQEPNLGDLYLKETGATIN